MKLEMPEAENLVEMIEEDDSLLVMDGMPLDLVMLPNISKK